MKVVINNRKINLDERAVLGSGGEAVVLSFENEAIKLYHRPTAAHAAKLLDLLRLGPQLPPQVIMPTAPVFDSSGRDLIGFSMPALPGKLAVLSSISNKGFRAAQGITLGQVSSLFMQIHATLEAIHSAGLVIGDFNDLNVLFEGSSASFIDVDSYQFGPYPCPVATEAFLDPLLYDLDLTRGPSFRPENDWYSFAVLLFRALLLAHPFGGTHPKVKLLTARAREGLTIFDPAVTYPKIALSPAFLSDDLASVFHNYFARGWRGPFPEAVLAAYATELQTCSSCGACFPYSRKNCPACQTMAVYSPPAASKLKGVRITEVLAADGPILACRVYGSRLYSIVREDNSVVLYIIQRDALVQRLVLCKWSPGMRFDFMENCLVINPYGSAELLLFQVEGVEVTPLLKTTTGLFAGQAVFATTARELYRIAGGLVLRGELRGSQLVERPLTSVLEGQTWFTASATPDGANIITGFERIFRTYKWFQLSHTGRMDLEVTPLELDEALLDYAVKSDGKQTLILRKTRQAALTNLRLDLLDSAGKLLFESRQQSGSAAEDDVNLFGGLYSAGVLLSAGEDNLLKERLQSSQKTQLSLEGACVNSTSQLLIYGNELLAVTDNRIWKLELN
ncbi:MAG TPA: hypothetical protein VH186_19955 [Chloroflexia bacterium]|nr:hypothetical protein [Chloroflexia bacterium]